MATAIATSSPEGWMFVRVASVECGYSMSPAISERGLFSRDKR